MHTLQRTLLVLLFVTSASALAGYDEGAAAYWDGDYATAMKEFRPLAEQGDAEAQFKLGLMYGGGEGVPLDYPEALRWFRKAAEQGLAKAQNYLGTIYARGVGVPQDYVEAHKCYNLAASKGYAGAAKNRDLIAAKMTHAQIAEAQKLAREWRPK
jgi:hypothetical protein